ncbi:Por secretion system C-terminal sorting domain-containing protein [Tenacibaculum sp. MAR_2009_124]|uniref:sulfatase-like hydrolase/transferase n=1 Tax=Tenacibaculum sp. MAR_2009_124 TaxID=1250059 RepID=UPI00089A4C37|nr:sulfatase-like hydrolase/transferase [Tenacibaculum sp. MAR_2009_124]SED06354.1 Por secretion system C-terminal sorting domain-containing protein [Tenacibaculum sp. MAR_2009_124]
MKNFIVNLLFFYSIFTLHSQNSKDVSFFVNVDTSYEEVSDFKTNANHKNYSKSQVVSFEKKSAQERKPNIILVMTDQWRRQALGFIRDGDPVRTPRLNRYKREDAVFFKNGIVNRPICGPNRANILTGQYNITNGVYGNKVRLSTKSNTLGDIAKANGYRTAFIGKWHLDEAGAPSGYVPPSRRHGFDKWIATVGHSPFSQKVYIDDSREPTRATEWEPTWLTKKLITFIKDKENNNGDKPFCAVLSLGPPHTGGGPGFEDRFQPGKRNKEGDIKYGYGYAAPKKWEDLYPKPEQLPRRVNATKVRVRKTGEQDDVWPTFPGYYGAVSSIDREFARLTKYLKDSNLFNNTIIVFTADHGELLGSHGRMTKGTWYEESVGVPMLISYPKKVDSKTEESPMSSIDIVPTILGLADINVPRYMDGFDYSKSLKGEQDILPEYAFCSMDQGEVAGTDRSWRSIYSDKYTYALANSSWRNFRELDHIREEDKMVLYDKVKDPYEMSPIYRGMGYDEVIDDLHQKLVDHLDRMNDPFIELQWIPSTSDTKYTYNNALHAVIPQPDSNRSKENKELSAEEIRKDLERSECNHGYDEEGAKSHKKIVYPSPVGSRINFRYPQGNLNVFNSKGMNVLSYTKKEEISSLDISSLKPGVYFIVFDGWKKEKFIKTK